MSTLLAFGFAFLGQAFFCGLISILEHYFPAQTRLSRGNPQNIAIGILLLSTEWLAGFWLGPFVTLVVNAIGGGLFILPAQGVWFLAGLAIYFIAMDFGEYIFHRAQHAIPFMWAMHSLHHSDPDFNTTTTVRHFWFDSWIKSVTIWLAVGLLFKATLGIVFTYGLISYYNFLTHANLKINYGRASWLLNSPAYHRVHHSSLPEHFDVNFSAVLPVFDVIFGSYYRPRRDEYPPTGLDTGSVPASIVEAILWPLRSLLKTDTRRASNQSKGTQSAPA